MFWVTMSGRTLGLDFDFAEIAAAVVDDGDDDDDDVVAAADGEAASNGLAPACWVGP